MSLSKTIVTTEPGERLDVLLARELGIGRALARRLVESRQALVDGRVCHRPGRILEAGCAVTVLSDVDRPVPQPELALPILAEGDGWLVVDKPSSMPVHPYAPGETGAALNALVVRYPNLHEIGEKGLRGGVVHRLDVDTSGTLVVATRQEVWLEIRSAFVDHRAHKRYRAIVLGEPPDHADLRMDLEVVRHTPARVAVAKFSTPGARTCNLRYVVRRRLRNAALVEVDLGTGFLHQIRVMMREAGHPVAGDAVYGSPDDLTGAPRQMLHAAEVSAGPAHATSPDPPDFAEVLQRLSG